ncbi:MAG: pitrilysin family protein [Rhodocyclaceae bacterium]|jgi:zinc protease|nr:pitrilysin family protein [Rhodocyclaceae bacterium]
MARWRKLQQRAGWLVLAVLATGAAPAAWGNPFETRLANGMKLIVKEDPRAPSAVHMVWYRVGAMDEVDGSSGVAHLLEHMMFKGTRKVGPGEFNKRVAALGGRDNAFTSHDYTAYFQQVPADRLEVVMSLEADRMAHLRLNDGEFAKELEVVKEERRLRTDDQPHSLVHEQLQASALLAHPYRRPVIGWMSDLERMKPEDARAWYRTWYAPNNATLVVVGDVDHRRVFEQARRHYGALSAKPLPSRREVSEPPQRGERRAVVRAPAELPYLALAWPTPTVRDLNKDRDYFALQVLAAVLDGYDGARLSTRLVKSAQPMAVSAGAGFDGMSRGASLFMLEGTPSAGYSVAELEAGLKGEIARIRQEGITSEELSRVKAQAVAAQVYKRDSLMGQAMEIGMLEMAGFSWRDDERLLAGLKSVTAEEVKAVANRYFQDETLTVVRLDPLPLAARKPAKASPTLRHGGGQ